MVFRLHETQLQVRKPNRANCNGKSKTRPQIQGVSKRDAKTKDLNLIFAGLY